MKKQFGITEKKELTWGDYIKRINRVFFVVVFAAFSFFIFYSRVTTLLFSKDKIDVFKEDLGQIAFYFRPVDKDFSQFLVTLDDVVKSYVAGDNVFKDKLPQIEYCRDYIKKNKEYLKKL